MICISIGEYRLVRQSWCDLWSGKSQSLVFCRGTHQTGALVTAVDLGEILAFGRQTHSQAFGNHEYESTYQQTPSRPLADPSSTAQHR
jgi:hypothetical protein